MEYLFGEVKCLCVQKNIRFPSEKSLVAKLIPNLICGEPVLSEYRKNLYKNLTLGAGVLEKNTECCETYWFKTLVMQR